MIPVGLIGKLGAKKKCKSRRICLCKFWNLVGVEISQQSWGKSVKKADILKWVGWGKIMQIHLTCHSFAAAGGLSARKERGNFPLASEIGECAY